MKRFFDTENPTFSSESEDSLVFKKLYLYLRFTLVQKEEEALFEVIESIFGGDYGFEEPKKAYRYLLVSETGLKLLLDYLDKYQLYSIKALSKKRFFSLFEKKNSTTRYPSTPEEWIEAYKLCKEINKFSPQEDDVVGIT